MLVYVCVTVIGAGIFRIVKWSYFDPLKEIKYLSDITNTMTFST
jgi:hypothetical protein